MTPAAVEQSLAKFHYTALTGRAAGTLLYELVLASDAEAVLELGFAHGTSTMYLAAALQERGSGVVVTIDREDALSRQPNVHELSAALELDRFVTPIFATRSYNWELKNLIERRSDGSQVMACFDLCFVDGAHSWYEDGLAFFLVDKLLRDDRWIVFDDIHWTYAGSATMEAEKLQSHPEAERDSAQVMDVFNLLVRQHPSYGEFRLLGNYAAAYKSGSGGNDANRDAFDRALSADVAHDLAFGPTSGMRAAHARAHE